MVLLPCAHISRFCAGSNYAILVRDKDDVVFASAKKQSSEDLDSESRLRQLETEYVAAVVLHRITMSRCDSRDNRAYCCDGRGIIYYYVHSRVDDAEKFDFASMEQYWPEFVGDCELSSAVLNQFTSLEHDIVQQPQSSVADVGAPRSRVVFLVQRGSCFLRHACLLGAVGAEILVAAMFCTLLISLNACRARFGDS